MCTQNPSLRRLSERPSPNSTPNTLRQRLPPSSTSSVASNPTIAASAPPSTIAPSPSRPGPNQTPQPTQSSQSPGSTGRGWADRFAEALLGGDEGNPESKYALICTKCFIHNGLVRKEELDTIRRSCLILWPAHLLCVLVTHLRWPSRWVWSRICLSKVWWFQSLEDSEIPLTPVGFITLRSTFKPTFATS